MSIQETLAHYETLIPHWKDEDWDKREWPHPEATAGMRVHRLWRKIGSDQVMLHRFIAEPGTHDPHNHPMAVAAHVLGGGEYEVGFVIGDRLQTRAVTSGDFYYEMITPEIRHYVMPRSTPVYSVAIWTEFPPPTVLPDQSLRLRPAKALRDHVVGVFERLWPLD